MYKRTIFQDIFWILDWCLSWFPCLLLKVFTSENIEACPTKVSPLCHAPLKLLTRVSLEILRAQAPRSSLYHSQLNG